MASFAEGHTPSLYWNNELPVLFGINMYIIEVHGSTSFWNCWALLYFDICDIYIYIKFYKLFVVANEKQIILIAYNSVQVSTPQIKPLKYLINAKKKLQLNYIIHIISRFVTRSSTWAPQPTHIFLACFHGSHTVSCRINMTCPSWTHVVLDSLMLKCLLWCWSKLSTLKWSPVWK